MPLDDDEKLMMNIAKDVALLAQAQLTCQKSQEQTTENINKLAGSVEKLAKEAIRLEGIFVNISSLESRIVKIESAYSKWSTAVYAGMIIALVGAVVKFSIQT